MSEFVTIEVETTITTTPSDDQTVYFLLVENAVSQPSDVGVGAPDPSYWTNARVHWSGGGNGIALVMEINSDTGWLKVAAFDATVAEGSAVIADALSPGTDPTMLAAHLGDANGAAYFYQAIRFRVTLVGENALVPNMTVAVQGTWEVQKQVGQDLGRTSPYTYTTAEGDDTSTWEAGALVLHAFDSAQAFGLVTQAGYDYDAGHPIYDLLVHTRMSAVLVADFTATVQDNGWIADFDASSCQGDIVLYQWDFADPLIGAKVAVSSALSGGVDIQTFAQGNTSPTTSHFYRVPDTYNVTLTVTDVNGQAASVSHSVVIPGGKIIGDPIDSERLFS